MKKLLLLLYIVFVSLNLFAQDPAIYGSWELYRIEIDANPGLQISDVEPAITPWLSINELLEFNGFGACNSFSGNFIYDVGTNKFESVNFQETILNCTTELHDDIEDEYFGYLNGIRYQQPMGVTVFVGNDGLEHMIIGNGSPGFWLDFVSAELAIDDLTKNKFQIYPNPSTGIINLQSSNLTETVELTLYNLQGQVLISAYKTPENGTVTIDVSSFSAGVYFIKIASGINTMIKKVIKK